MTNQQAIITPRLNALDTVRGMLMFYIVFVIHGLFWLNIVPQWAGSLMLFEMPAIFIVSGYSYYFYEASRERRTGQSLNATGYLSFLVSRFTRILVPYFVYAAACAVFLYFSSALGGAKMYSLAALLIAWMNPLTYGANQSVGMLNWHLWFIPVFLTVTALMPIATRIKIFKSPNMVFLVLGFSLVEWVLSLIYFPGDALVKSCIFYLVFALLGYYLASAASYFRAVNFLGIIMLALALLAMAVLFAGDFRSMNMQINKFPPNQIFFAFSSLWVSMFLFILFKCPIVTSAIEKCGQFFFFRPFVSFGYSIYLWQGVGYTVAGQVGAKLHLPVGIIWLLALALSVGLGTLAAPVEKLRARF